MNTYNADPILKVCNAKKYFPVYKGFLNRKVGDVKALDDISLSIANGETVGIVGESGCGKSTLGNSIMGLEKLTSGKIFYQDGTRQMELSHLNQDDMKYYRSKVQMIFQDPYAALNPSKKIYDSLMLPLRVHLSSVTRGEQEDILYKTLQVVQLDKKSLYKYPHEFSGGQRQRICIARALCVNPRLIICDEPVSALDVSIQAQVLNLMKRIQEQNGMTYLFIAHDLSVVQYMSNRIVVMYLGQVMEIADRVELYLRSLHPYTQALISAVPVPVIGVKKNRIILAGDVPSPITAPKGCPFSTRCKECRTQCKDIKPPLREVSKNHFVACHLI
ncbi:MAG: ABC transporter ATP-binding protein [Raoultibacter sp.]